MSAVEIPPATTASTASTPLLRTLALCDLVDSTALVERLGDQAAAALLRKHDRFARDLVLRHDGHEIDKTDGFLVLFERPIQAVAFALAYQRGLDDLSRESGQLLRARVGLHVGDVVLWENTRDDVAHGAKPVELEGLVKPVTARLAALALPSQILVSGVAATLAQRAHSELGADSDRIRWLNHGRYRFKGVPEPLVVYEVGESGVAPLRLPPYSGKAWREVPWWRRPGSLFIESAILLGVLGLIAWSTLRPQPAIAFGERDWVVMGTLKNLSQQARLDDAVQTALRIGLEQSRHVNVVPELQIRDALRRMQRDPLSTPIDRSVGAELAVREGARALIVPVLTAVGDKIRVSAEIIDPQTQATVYSASAEGVGVDSVLTSADTLIAGLRERLGESLASINSTGAPLNKVTTANLDALRAYSQAALAMADGKANEAVGLYGRAIELDPEFSAARLQLGGIYYATGRKAKAYELAQQAAQQPERLSSRDRLITDAFLAMFDTPQRMIEKWGVLMRLYPDMPAGPQNSALLRWWYLNDAGAVSLFEQVGNSRDPRRGFAWLFIGEIRTAGNDFAGAEAAFGKARELGAAQVNLNPVHLPLARGDHAAVEKAIAAEGTHAYPFFEVEKSLRSASLHTAMGDLALAHTKASEAEQAARQANIDSAVARAQLAQVAIAAAQGDTHLLARLETLIDSEAQRLQRLALEHDYAPAAHLALAAMIASRHGHDALARRAIAAASDIDGKGYHNLDQPLAVARCETQIADNAAEAVTCLRALLGPRAYYQTHVALARALQRSGDANAALTETRWLALHRGQAVAEWMADYAAQVPNLLAANEALLQQAELAATLDQRAEAAAALAQFRRTAGKLGKDLPWYQRAAALDQRLATP